MIRDSRRLIELSGGGLADVSGDGFVELSGTNFISASEPLGATTEHTAQLCATTARLLRARHGFSDEQIAAAWRAPRAGARRQAPCGAARRG
jgi:hypothetical protein